MHPRIVHFGIDGGSFAVLDALASRGLMPEYDALRRDAGRAVLRSTLPWFTVPAWITWMTGVSAERHGLIYWSKTSARDFWDRSGDSRRFVTFGDISNPTVFRLLSDAGIRVASINMPVTFPPPDVNGVVVSGFGSPPDIERASSPPGFLRAYPVYRIDMEDSVENVLGTPRARSASMIDADISLYAEQLAAMAEARHRVFADMLNEDFGLASVVYVGADRLSHVAWPHVAAVLDGRDGGGAQRAVAAYYSTLDRILGETRRLAGDALFLVTSDHGQGAPPVREIAINAWLMESGWLRARGPGVRRVARLGPSAARRWLWSAWRRVSNAPAGSAPLVDWDRTVAYGIPMSHCRVVGVAVRDAVRDAGALRREIAEGLLALTDPRTGGHPIERVVFADDICRDHGRTTYPDLLGILGRDYGATGKADGDVVRDAPPGASGFHEPEGILLAAGPGVGRGEHTEASIADIAPTILRAQGLEPLPDMDGSALSWVVDGVGPLRTVERSAEPDNAEQLSARDEEVIESHLRNLGYVD